MYRDNTIVKMPSADTLKCVCAPCLIGISPAVFIYGVFFPKMIWCDNLSFDIMHYLSFIFSTIRPDRDNAITSYYRSTPSPSKPPFTFSEILSWYYLQSADSPRKCILRLIYTELYKVVKKYPMHMLRNNVDRRYICRNIAFNLFCNVVIPEGPSNDVCRLATPIAFSTLHWNMNEQKLIDKYIENFTVFDDKRLSLDIDFSREKTKMFADRLKLQLVIACEKIDIGKQLDIALQWSVNYRKGIVAPYM